MRPHLEWADVTVVRQELGARPAGQGGCPRRPMPAPLPWPEDQQWSVWVFPSPCWPPAPPGSLTACWTLSSGCPDPQQGLTFCVLCLGWGWGLGFHWGALQCLPTSSPEAGWARGPRFGPWSCVSCVWAKKQCQACNLDGSCVVLSKPLLLGRGQEGGRGLEVPEASYRRCSEPAWGGALQPGCPPGVTLLLSGPQPSTPAPWAMVAASTTASSSQ